jgi:alkylhydroperoxidase family enzyme
VIVCASVATLGDSYCSLAWGKRLADAADAETAAAVLRASGEGKLDAREKALADWARKVVRSPNATTAEDVVRLRAAGLGEREIFEATALVAFRVAFSTVNDALGARPDRQLAEAAPAAVREAVSFGRAVDEAHAA